MANNEWEDTFAGNFKQHPILGATTLGVAPALATGFGKLANIMTYKPSAEQKLINQKNFEGYVADRVGSGIGSSRGAARLGVPTSAGVAPFWSMSFGNNSQKADVAPPRQNLFPRDTNWEGALQAPPVVPPPAPVTPKGKGVGKATPQVTPTPLAPVAKPVYAGYGAYADGSVINPNTWDDGTPKPGYGDINLMAGNNAMPNPNNTKLNLTYSPEQAAEIQAQKAQIAQGYENAPQGSPFGGGLPQPGSQEEWAQNQGRMNGINSILESMPQEHRDLLGPMANARATKQYEMLEKLGVDKGNLGVNQFNAQVQGANVGSEIERRGVQNRLETEAAPITNNYHRSLTDKNYEDIKGAPGLRAKTTAETGEINKKISLMDDDSLARLYTAMGLGHSGSGTGTNAPGVDTATLMKERGAWFDRIPLAQDNPEMLREIRMQIANIDNLLASAPAKGTVATKSPMPPIAVKGR